MPPRAVLLLAAAAAAALAVVLARDGTGEGAPATDARCGPTLSAPWEVGVDQAGTATVCLINRERSERGLPPLAPNAQLAQAAARHSRDMVTRGYFEHESPDGATPQDRIRATGWGRGTSASTAENIAWGEGRKATPAAIVADWMGSPPHRESILRPAFREIGVGIVLGAPARSGSRDGATYTTTFGGVFDPALGSG